MTEEKRLKKKVNRLVRKHRDFKLAMLEYAIEKMDNELIETIRERA